MERRLGRKFSIYSKLEALATQAVIRLLIQRLQRLRQEEERLLLYLMPVDTNDNDRLDHDELDRLLTSIGQLPLTSKEQEFVFMGDEQSISWHDFVDRLLLS